MRTCTIEGCDNKHRAKGYCSAHYKQAFGRGDKVRPCECCGQDYSVRRTDQRFCSILCREYTRHGRAYACALPCNCEAKRLWNRAHRRQRRTVERAGIPYLDANIHQRDGWTCGICSKSVDPNLLWPHPKSASIDHVLPVIEGGTDEPANVRCSHLDCNIRRGARGGSEQLALIG